MNKVTLKNDQNGNLRTERVGYAWFALLFNCLYLLYRKDWISFAVCLLLESLFSMLPSGWAGIFYISISVLICFFYNKIKIEYLLKHGWSLTDKDPNQINHNKSINTITHKELPINEKNKTPKIPLTRRWWFWAIVVFVISSFVYGVVNPANDNGSSENKLEEKNEPKKQNSTENSDTEDETESDENESALDKNEINKNIASSLKEDQKFAQKGDDRFAYAKFIKKIRYQEDNTDVFVNANFLSLSETDKNTVAEKIQGIVGSSIAMVDDDYEPSDDQEGYNLGFWYGKRAVGHSKMNYHKYKWYNFD